MQTRPRINKDLYDKVKLNGMTFNESLNLRIAHNELVIKLKDIKIECLERGKDKLRKDLGLSNANFIFSLTLSICFGFFIAGDKLGLFEFIGGLIDG